MRVRARMLAGQTMHTATNASATFFALLLASAASHAQPGTPDTRGRAARPPPGTEDRIGFSLDNADLAEVVRVIAQLTGKSFLFGANVQNIHATVFSPEKLTVAEAYQAFLSILHVNGLTLVSQGHLLKIVDAAGAASRAPMFSVGQAVPDEERYVTRLMRLRHARVDEVAAVLGHFKTKDGEVTTYSPSNLLIVTDTGANLRRMTSLIEEIDLADAGESIWLEPIHYASASAVAKELSDVFGTREGASKPPTGTSTSGASAPPGATAPGARLIADDRTNALVIVGAERAYLRMLELVKRLDVPQSGQGQIHVLPLQHADAIDLARSIGEIVGAGQGDGPPGPGGGAPGPPSSAGIFEGRIKVSADKSTNALVVTSSLRDYAALRGVVDRLDQARRQVFIEAIIMDVSTASSSTVGTNFHLASTLASSSGDGLVYGGLNPTKTIGLPDSTSLQGLALGVRGPGLPGSSTLLGTGVTIPEFGVMFSALAHQEHADVLSTPSILATDNIPAEINVGQNIPLQTNVGGGLSSLSSLGGSASSGASALGGATGGGGAAPRQDVGTKLKVTAHLNDSNEVRLELSEEISEAGATPTGSLGTVPIVKRTAQTTLTIRDQETVVIGGLLRSRKSRSVDKIPLLGDIPLLGILFRQSTSDSQRTELVLVLTPYIIREQSDLRAIFERKMHEQQEFLDHVSVFNSETRDGFRHPSGHTKGLLEDIREQYANVAVEAARQELLVPRPVMRHEPSQPLPSPSDAGDPPVAHP